MSEDIQINDDISVDELLHQLEQAKAAAEANLNGWKRAQADLMNFKEAQEKKNSELIEFAREVAVAKLLPSLDSLGQALIHSPSVEPSEDSIKFQISNFKFQINDKGQVAGSEFVDLRNFAEQYQIWSRGIAGIIKQLDKALEELGVKKIEALGKKFDPNFHEAIKEVEGAEEGLVVEEFVPGYTINGKVVRASQVGIGK